MTRNADNGEGVEPGLTVEIVDGPPPLPGAPSYAIRKWDNHGLKAGTHRLYTCPLPDAGDRERARAAVHEWLREDTSLGVKMAITSTACDKLIDRLATLTRKDGG